MPGVAIPRRSSRLLIAIICSAGAWPSTNFPLIIAVWQDESRGSYTEILFDRAHVGFYMINDGEAVGFKVLSPFLAASAVCISMNIDCQGLCCLSGRTDEQRGECCDT